jgi:hypothetical protein
MSHWFPSRSFVTFAAFFAVLLTPAMAQSSASKAKKEKSKPQLRLICATALADDQDVILAARDKEGKWLELGSTSLRASFVTDWLPASTGELHLALRDEKELKSICQFQYPEDAKNALVMLISNEEKTKYEVKVIDPKKIEFVVGSTLVVNFSPHTGVVQLGSNELKIEPDQQAVAKPVVEENGMFQMQVSYLDADGKSQPRYDRYVSGKPDSRSVLFLIPDTQLSLRSLSLPLFGDLD